MTRIIAALLATAAVLLVPTKLAPRADAATAPATFVESVVCQADGTSTAAFVVPGPDDTRAALDARGVRGLPEEVWIDISLFDNGFARGTFLGLGPFATPSEGNGGVAAWGGLLPARIHYYRLNALVDGRWTELGRGAFDTPDCIHTRSFTCDPRDETSAVIFELASFRSAPGRPIEQWVDLTLFNNGFAPGTFLGVGPFPPPTTIPSPPPAEATYEWRGISPLLRHYARVNVLLASGVWDQEAFVSFLSLDCRGLALAQRPL